jgi:gamma-glutamylcyclotransferase
VDRAWYFAYGSNMQTATFRGRRGIEFERALAVRAPGWRLVLDKPPLLPVGESYANIVCEAGAEVLGVAYEVSADALSTIDLTEGVPMGNYQRRAITVVPLADDGSAFEAFTLVSDRHDPELQPSTRYLALLIDGAVEHGLPAAYVDILRRIPARAPSPAATALRPLIDGAMALARRRRS